jgi:hypothetical protein
MILIRNRMHAFFPFSVYNVAFFCLFLSTFLIEHTYSIFVYTANIFLDIPTRLNSVILLPLSQSSTYSYMIPSLYCVRNPPFSFPLYPLSTTS